MTRERCARFEDCHVLVTGGAGGVGRVLAAAFVDEGAVVSLLDCSPGRASAAAAELNRTRGSEVVSGICADVSDARAVAAAFDEAHATFGDVRVLVVGAAHATDSDIIELSEAGWEKDVDTTLKGAFLCMQAALPGMLRRGSGAIVSIASVNAFQYCGNAAYSAAKAGLVSLTKSVAVRYGKHGVRANVVAPGSLRTPAWDEREALRPGSLDRLSSWYPQGRVGEPGDVVGPVLFLASDEAAWVSGAVLPVDGGFLAGTPGFAEEVTGVGLPRPPSSVE